MKILIACEESQAVCKEMRRLGHEAYSADIQDCSGGHPYSKKTCLWLRGLSPLVPTAIVTEGITPWVSAGSKDAHGNPRKKNGMGFRDPKVRSKTFPGIARAMAEQWAGRCEA